MDTPLIAQGSKIGMHAIRPNQVIPLVRQAHARGVTWPLVKAVDNGGVAIDVKAIEPRTLTITRFVNDAEDAAQGVGQWSPADMRRHAGAALDAVWGRLNSQERAAADWIEPINEADPRGNYGAFGLYLCELVRQADGRGMKLAIPALNAGTPEWNDMQALVASGLFKLMRAGGHILTIHEGVFGAQPVDKGFGDLIPGSPVVAGAGSLCFRYRYLYSLLAARDEVVPLVVSEFYAGGSYQLPAADQVARFAWYDRLARQDSYVLAVLPFTVDPDDGWRGSDYTYAYGAVLDYLVAEKDKPNATTLAPSPIPTPVGGGDPPLVPPTPVGGGNPPAVPPAPGGTHRVKATLLNIRQFPWAGNVVPPLVGTLAQGTVVTILGVYKTGDMAFGWGCLSADGNQWVSMQWVELFA